MEMNLRNIAETLKKKDNYYILTHTSPDGDTLGSAYALCAALQQMGKNARVLCGDEIAAKYDILKNGVITQDFACGYVISVDVADVGLLGEVLARYAGCVDLCIDHHVSNSKFSRCWYVDDKSAATCEIIYELLKSIGIEINKNIATCIYAGISTDTGCFRHANATARSYRIAAEMIDCGADPFVINKLMFDTKSKAQMYIECAAIESMEFFCDGRCAVISVANDVIIKNNAKDSDFDGLSALPRQVEGVLVGVLLREIEPEVYKVSVRSDESIDASQICAKFGGGGHRCAAGCTITGALEDVKNQVISAVSRYLPAVEPR